VHIRTERLLLREFRPEDLDAGDWALRGYGMWVAEELETGRFVGRIGLHYPEVRGLPHDLYRLARAA
jgi:RimJ/RimL family protein N-acetyltransferase